MLDGANRWPADKIKFVSAAKNTFNEDMGVSFSKEQVDGKTAVYNYNRS